MRTECKKTNYQHNLCQPGERNQSTWQHHPSDKDCKDKEIQIRDVPGSQLRFQNKETGNCSINHGNEKNGAQADRTSTVEESAQQTTSNQDKNRYPETCFRDS